MDIKAQIAPKGLEFRPSDFIISDKYATILTVISYPKYIAPGFLSDLTSMSGIKMVIKHIPFAYSEISKMLNKEIAELKEQYQQERDKTIQERIRQDYESLEAFIQMIAATQAKIYDFQLHIMITADSEEELTNKKMQIKNYLEAMQLRAVPLRFEQEKVLKSILPIFPDQDIEERIGTPIPSPTIAAMYPFIFDSIKDPGLATLLGVDFSGGVILFNQFLYQIQKEQNRNNANLIILGTSGSGKSTLANLISRFYDIDSGKILIGNVNVKDIEKKELMNTISFVFQNSKLLKTSIYENVKMAKPEATKVEVLHALHLAQCDDIIKKLPKGIDTVIGTKGVYLSGGEEQRINIARIMLKDSKVVILDEATAFADPENEIQVQKAFEELSKNKTVIMIAHRLSTIRNVDKIYVLNNGKIEEEGKHEELLKKNGLYKEMWDNYQTSISWKVGENV